MPGRIEKLQMNEKQAFNIITISINSNGCNRLSGIKKRIPDR